MWLILLVVLLIILVYIFINREIRKSYFKNFKDQYNIEYKYVKKCIIEHNCWQVFFVQNKKIAYGRKSISNVFVVTPILFDYLFGNYLIKKQGRVYILESDFRNWLKNH